MNFKKQLSPIMPVRTAASTRIRELIAIAAKHCLSHNLDNRMQIVLGWLALLDTDPDNDLYRDRLQVSLDSVVAQLKKLGQSDLVNSLSSASEEVKHGHAVLC